MNDLIKILVGILIGVILVGCAVLFAPHDVNDNATDSTPIIEQVQESVSDNTNGGIDLTNQNTTGAASANGNNGTASQVNSGSGVSGGGVEYNGQEGGGDMYQINYSDGNFRQYDTKTGELIGSTFDEDQEKLGVVNGDLL